MRTASSGPMGLLLMVIGALLTGGLVWMAWVDGGWAASLPSICIGLALVATGSSLLARARNGSRGR